MSRVGKGGDANDTAPWSVRNAGARNRPTDKCGESHRSGAGTRLVGHLRGSESPWMLAIDANKPSRGKRQGVERPTSPPADKPTSWFGQRYIIMSDNVYYGKYGMPPTDQLAPSSVRSRGIRQLTVQRNGGFDRRSVRRFATDRRGRHGRREHREPVRQTARRRYGYAPPQCAAGPPVAASTCFSIP